MSVPCEKTDITTPCPQAIAAAEHAVKQVFAIIGVNVTDPEKVEAFREELRFGRRVKKISDRTVMAAIASIVTIATAAILHKMGFV